ncbi:inositol phosphate phosphatase SopB [Endozoicomonas elysicola]|uniref:Uncharacterized protein n=1 Tax=Endozoicomonas elysicola TaxID=305900 RepID=A0A081KCQ5_9GAMM|nr:inositol phosphate phosphatase SopB [Endozoicomonas elysicola]KEI71931.1 hypothetical protein GV64_15395 [Endozoicomonas elysicola]
MIPKNTPTGPKPAVNSQHVDQQTTQDGTEPKTGSWHQRIVKKIKKLIISPIKAAIHRARYHPKGSLKRPVINQPIRSWDIQHLPESRQLLSQKSTLGAAGNSNTALFSLEALYYNAALHVIKDAKNAPGAGFGSDLLLLERELEYEKQQEYNTLNLKGGEAASKTEIKHAKNLSKSLKTRLEKAGVSKALVTSNYRQHVNQALNERNWEVLHSAHQTNAGTLEHRQVPASKMQLLTHEEAAGTRDIFETSYGELGGICSQTKDSEQHAVNLWTSSFSPPKGKFNYHGVRHGIHSAIGIKDSEQRKTANLNRARESLIAALTLKPELLNQAISNPAKSVHLNLASVSLVTPDPFRIGEKSEAKMLLEQIEAFRELGCKQPLKLSVVNSNGRQITIRITFRLALFNFGVNKGAQGTFSRMVGGWKMSDKLNKEGLHTLIGGTEKGLTRSIAGDYLAKQQQHIITLSTQLADSRLPDNGRKAMHNELIDLNQKRTIIFQLATQIRDIFNSKAHHHESHDAYKMPARIALLTSLISGVPLSNCKSGKDRTGMLDAEIKLLATMIDLYGKVPEPGIPLSWEDAELFRDILLHSKNLEIQKLNTGAEGYKTEGIESIDEHMGKTYLSKDAFNEFRARVRGLSGAVKA